MHTIIVGKRSEISAWSNFTTQQIRVLNNAMCHRETERDFHPPWNFSWVVEGELAAMGWPRTPTNVNYIIKENIKHLVTLSPEMLPAVSNRPELSWTLIPVEEFEPPTVDQIAEFIDICIENRQRNRVGVYFWQCSLCNVCNRNYRRSTILSLQFHNIVKY